MAKKTTNTEPRSDKSGIFLSVKELWVNALRSGQYRKCKEVLRYDGKFCALGVLCDLHAKATERPSNWKRGIDDRDLYTYIGNIGNEYYTYIPLAVVRWSGLNDDNPVLNERTAKTVTEYNDDESHGYSFKAIADLIEKNL